MRMTMPKKTETTGTLAYYPARTSPPNAGAQDVRVDHRGVDIAVAEQLLERADVVAGFEQVGGKAVPQRMRADRLGQTGAATRVADGALGDGLVQVVAAVCAAARVDGDHRRGEHPLPAPLALGVRVFAREPLRQPHTSEARRRGAMQSNCCMPPATKTN